MVKIVLCIDDEPVRYKLLSHWFAREGVTLVVTCRLEDVNFYLEGDYHVIGVCLDHDMPFQNGMYFAEILREKNIPVAVTSLNPYGAQNIKNILDEYETPCILTPCTDRFWQQKVFEFFPKGDC